MLMIALATASLMSVCAPTDDDGSGSRLATLEAM
jgi:hypothetical protein